MITITLLKGEGMRRFLAVNFKCPMKPAFFHIWLLLQSPLLRYRRFGSLWHSSKQMQRLHLNQGGLHDNLYIALTPDIAVLMSLQFVL